MGARLGQNLGRREPNMGRRPANAENPPGTGRETSVTPRARRLCERRVHMPEACGDRTGLCSPAPRFSSLLSHPPGGPIVPNTADGHQSPSLCSEFGGSLLRS